MDTILYRGLNGNRHGLLVHRGRKWIKIILMDLPVKVRRLPVAEIEHCVSLDYPTAKAVRHFKDAARQTYETMRNAPKSLREVLR